MERQIPKNVRQIGNVSDNPKIYVEDYVDTFFLQLCDKCEQGGGGPVGAFLIGDMQEEGEDQYVYIFGAIQMHEITMSGNEYVIGESTWKQAYEECRQFFEDGEMIGWFVAQQGVPLVPDHSTVKMHKKSFPGQNTVFIMKDPAEKEEVYYVHKMNDLMEIGGHYTYYEKNPCMQNYMISARKKNGEFPSETVEDRAAKDFRNLVRTKSEGARQKKAGGLMYAVSACLVLVLIVMGVSMVNNFDRMKAVQSTLDSLAGKTDAVETQETSGKVTAVTSGEGEAGVSGETQDTDSDGSGQAGSGIQDEAQETDGTPGDGDIMDSSTDGSTAEEAEEGSSADPETQSVSENSKTDGQADRADTAAAGENGSDGIYIVEKGDTLAIISRKMYGDLDHVDAICRMNGLTDGNLIYVGQKLLLP